MTTEYTSHPALCTGPDPRHAGQKERPELLPWSHSRSPWMPPTARLPFFSLSTTEIFKYTPRGASCRGSCSAHTSNFSVWIYGTNPQHYVILPSPTQEGMAVMSLPFLPKTKKLLNS